VIFGIGNGYQTIYADLYKLKSGLNGWLCQEKPISKCCYAINRTKTGVTSGLKWYYLVHPKSIIFGVKILQLVKFQ